MTDVDAVLEELRAAGLFRRAAGDRQRGGPARDARRARGPAAVLERLPRARRAPGVRAAAAPGGASAGAPGAGASPLVSGHTALHAQLEEELAAFKGSEACLLFGSGFLANTGVIAALAGRGRRRALRRAQPRLDRRRLPARARADRRLPPRRPRRARGGAARAPDGRAVIVTDAVFSMDGDLAPLDGHRRARAPPRSPRGRRRGARHRRRRAGRPRPRRRARPRARGRRRDRDARQGARLLRRLRVLRRDDRRLPRQPRAHADLLDRAAAACARRRARGAAAAAPSSRRSSRALQANARALRAELAGHGFAVEPGDMPIVPLVVGAPERRDRALRGGAAARRLRPGDPPADRARGQLAAARSSRPRRTPRPTCARRRTPSPRRRAS